MKFARVCLMTGVLVAMSALSAQAGEPTKATTDELPAALRALNPNAGQILTTAAAQEIRGEGGNKYGHSKKSGHPGMKRYASLENYLGVQSLTGDITISGKNIRIGSHNHHFRIK